MLSFDEDEIEFRRLASSGDWKSRNAAERIIHYVHETGGYRALEHMILAFRDDPSNPLADHLFKVLERRLIPSHS